MNALSFLLSLSACLLWTGTEGQNSGDLRLVARNGQTSRYLTAGRLEVYYNQQWGTVCSYQFGLFEALTACHQLGFPDGYLHYTSVQSTISGLSTTFSPASLSTPTWFQSLSCGVYDTKLIDCASSIGIESCSHSNDVALFCEGNGAMRLSTSITASAGLVEVYYNGVWGTVCGNSFDKTDANVACQQLGYPSATSYGNAVSLGYGRSVGSIWLSNLACTSSDIMLSTCPNARFGDTSGCSHSDDVAVTCKAFKDDNFTRVTIGLILGTTLPICCLGICAIIIVIVSCQYRRRRRRNAAATTIPASATAAATYSSPESAPPPYPGSPQGDAPTGSAYPQQQQPPYSDEPQKAKVEMQEYQADPLLDYPPQS